MTVCLISVCHREVYNTIINQSNEFPGKNKNKRRGLEKSKLFSFDFFCFCFSFYNIIYIKDVEINFDMP